MKTFGTYFQNSAEHPLCYGEVELIDPPRRRRRGEPEKKGVEAYPVFCGFCGTDMELYRMGKACALETFLSCIEEAAHGANIILIGNGKRETTFVHSVLLKKELNVFGSRNALTADFETLIDLVAAGGADVLKMVSAVYEKEDAAAAFEALTHNDGSLAKVLLRFADAEA